MDYNLEITRIDDWEDCRNIKECAIEAFNKVLRKYDWSDCEDSTSSLTTEKRYFLNGNDTEFSIDVCIVCKDIDGNYYRLIHEKTPKEIVSPFFDWLRPICYHVAGQEATEAVGNPPKGGDALW